MKPLLRRTKLFPGETLPSLLERLTRLNYYDHSGVIGRICQDASNSPGRDYLSRPKRAETFAQLARLTGIAPEQLFDACAHRFAPMLTAPGQKKTFLLWLDGQPRQMATAAIVGRRIRSPIAAQFCPLCLKGTAYHRLSWVPVPSAVCLQHQCLLVHRCPDCGKKVTVSEIIEGKCSACKVELSSASSLSVAGDEPGITSQQMIQSWFTVAPVPELPQRYAPPTPHPHVLFHLFHVLCRGLLACQESWPCLPPPLSGLSKESQEKLDARATLSPHSAYFLYRAAFQAVVSWPHGFYEFLDAYSQRNHEARTSPVPVRRLGMIWRHWISKAWRRPEFEFVHQALVDYFVRRGIPLSHTLIDRFKDAPWFPERSGLWTKEQAAQVLGISERMRDVFLPQDPLGRCMAPESRARFPIFSRDKVLAVKKQWEEGLPLGDAAWWLGLERTDVIKLVERGELSLIRGQQDEDPGDWILEKQSLVAFFEAIDGQLKLYQDDPRELICLFEAFHLTSWEGVGKLALLKGIADGVLPGYKQEPSLRCLARVHFLRSTVTQLPKLIYAQRGWISGYAFALQKGLSLYTIDEWMKLGLLEPVATFNYRHYFDVQSIERVAAVYPPRR